MNAAVRRPAAWISAYAVAMALVEAAVVIYLRALDPEVGPLAVLRTVIPERLVVVEILREAATLVMLLAVAALAGRTAWQRFLQFALAFGVWDIFYYVWLKLLLGWPESLLTWDVLFLIPTVWISPVLAPVLVSVCLVVGSLWLLDLDAREEGAVHGLPGWAWAVSCLGGLVVILSFTIDAEAALTGSRPPRFRWWLFLAGVGLAVAAVFTAARRARRFSRT